MPLNDELASTLAALGETFSLDGRPVSGLFNVAGEVVLEGVLTTGTTAVVLAAENAQRGQQVVRDGVTYLIKQVLPRAPDGALVQLVLAKV